MTSNRLSILLVATLLSACATTNPNPVVSKAAVTPLNDLNLVKTAIPDVLSMAQSAPYAFPEARTCTDLAASVQSLDDVLGPDLDAPPSQDAQNAVQNAVERGLANAVQNAAEGIIPYRGWVRKITGAERHAKQISAAIAAGTVRRAFLKGIAKAESC